MKQLIIILIFSIANTAFAGTADTITLFSKAMQKSINCTVIKPDSYKKKTTRYPVVYLLHGYSGDYANWVTRVPELKQYCDDYQILIVCPDGGYSSWYFDSPVDSTMRYETHIADEVVSGIDQRYRTLPDRRHRAITGLSMGGHGGIFLAWRHAGIFGACGSMSGGVDINSCRRQFDIGKRLGDTLVNAGNWKNLTVINLIEKKPADNLAIIIDCGIDDIFYTANHNLHQKMLALHIPHDYTERPGRHDWDYWRKAVLYQLLFFKQYFNGKQPA